MANISSQSENTFAQKFTVSPNPSDGKFFIEFQNKFNIIKVEVYSLIGQKIFEENFKNSTICELDLFYLSSGTYLLRVVDGSNSTNKLLIKK